MILGVEEKAMQRSGKALSVKKSELKCASGLWHHVLHHRSALSCEQAVPSWYHLTTSAI